MNIAIIPAKGFSRRLPGKNLRPFHGKPVIAYSINAAKESGLFDAVIVSTDDQEITKIAHRYGAMTLRRGAHYADSELGTQEVAAGVLRDMWVRGVQLPEYVCVIYPCAPLLTGKDLRDAAFDNAECPYVYAEGQFYFGKAESFMREPDAFDGCVLLEDERFIDINTIDDFRRAEAIYAGRMARPEVEPAQGVKST